MPKAIHPFAVIRRPLITEKATTLAAENKYAFEVDPRSNKLQIREAVETSFNVHVTAVNVINVKGKMRRFGRQYTKTVGWKKAIVTLAAGDKIELFEGM